MPSQDQMESVTNRIGWLKSTDYGLGEGMSSGAAPDEILPWWQGLSNPERVAVLDAEVVWEGFSDAQKESVIERVVDGQDSEFWMDGIEQNKGLDTESDRKIDGFITNKDINGYLSWLTGDPQKTRERLEQVEAYDAKIAKTSGNRPVSPMTERLIDILVLDVWPGNDAVVDFGIESDRHLMALQFAVREELVTPQELEAARCNGEKLNEIALRGDNPYRDVVFRTSWDRMFLDQAGDHGADDIRALFAEMREDEQAARVRDYGEADAVRRGQIEKILFGNILEDTPSPRTEEPSQPNAPSQGEVRTEPSDSQRRGQSPSGWDAIEAGHERESGGRDDGGRDF